MRRWAALALLAWASGGAAQEFRRTVADTTGGSVFCVTWNRRDFSYHFDPAGSARTPGDTELAAIDDAFATWQALADTCSDFTFTRGAPVTRPAVGPGSAGENVVVFREVVCPADAPCVADGSCARALGCWDHSSGVIALTTVTYSTRTGVALDADMELNAAGFLFTTVPAPPCQDGREAVTCVAYDVQNTVTHEIGHMLGFDHVEAANSTMAPTAPVGETSKRIIDLGTADGLCRTYPRGQPPVPCDDVAQLQRHVIARGTGTFACGSANSAQAAPLVLAALAFMTMLRRRVG
jgi:hypothetical protein